MEATSPLTDTKALKEAMVVSKVDSENTETGPTEDSELTKEEDSNVASMGNAGIAANMDTRPRRVDLSE